MATATPSGSNLEIPIILTATVIPNGVAAPSIDPKARLAEYTAALQFYLSFAPVIFLENSPYPLEQHPEFRETDRLRVCRFVPSASPERGKGYQEFEMLDAWMASVRPKPERWLKITGRYQLRNIGAILDECRQHREASLIIDQIPRAYQPPRGMARTYSFCVDTGFYQKNISGLYRQCDDRTNNPIERVLFHTLKPMTTRQVRSFTTQPRIAAVAGSTGAPFPSGRGQWLVKQILRSANRLLDRRYLWYPK